MKQLLILSGKGGTGKTTVATGFISLSQAECFADCDVDAPNLHLVLHMDDEPTVKPFQGMKKAFIDQEKCIGCNACYERCRFDAISILPGTTKQEYHVDAVSCEGCAVCQLVCPVDAVTMKEDQAGELRLYNQKRVFSTAQLNMGSGTSGKLVSFVKAEMKTAANPNTKIAIIDGSPGIGCPVIASLSAVDLVLVVAEPSLSGISDMKRIIITAKKFGIDSAVCVNKFDTNSENSDKIEAFCKTENIPFVGRIPYDMEAVYAINHGLSITERPGKAADALKLVYEETMRMLG